MRPAEARCLVRSLKPSARLGDRFLRGHPFRRLQLTTGQASRFLAYIIWIARGLLEARNDLFQGFCFSLPRSNQPSDNGGTCVERPPDFRWSDFCARNYSGSAPQKNFRKLLRSPRVQNFSRSSALASARAARARRAGNARNGV